VYHVIFKTKLTRLVLNSLWGHSFGAYIGIKGAAKAPENYITYIGIR
jgi:pimeloyl-ACP methyl ester carboxylesterase